MLALVGVIAASVFTTSFEAMLAMANEMGLSPVSRYFVPIGIDGGILVFSSVAAGFKAQGRKVPWVTIALDAGLVVMSVCINVWHTMQHTNSVLAWVVAGGQPAILFGSALTVRRYAFDERRIRAPRRAPARVNTEQRSADTTATVNAQSGATPAAAAAPQVSDSKPGEVRSPRPTPAVGSTQQQVLELHEQGKTNKEIAEIVGIHPSGVSRHISKARAAQHEAVAA